MRQPTDDRHRPGGRTAHQPPGGPATPSAPHRTTRHRTALARTAFARTALALALLTGPLALGAGPSAADPGEGPPGAGPGGAAAGPVPVLLELATEAAGPAWQRAGDRARRERRSPEAARRAAAAAGADQRRRAADALDGLARAVRDGVPDARELYRTRTLLTALAVSAPAERLPALRALPGVRAVHPIVRKERLNGHSVPLTGAPAVWGGPAGDAADGTTGAGTRIGIVDSGIDYTHADFGGPGTEEAFRAVDGARPAPAELFPNAKVVGGRDLVGDDYDPDPTSPHHQPVPHPDDNPIDCATGGHGTHVAGTAAGLGVTADGRTYRGPYRPGLDPAAFSVAPGAAPGAQLYAIRVFGCNGGTDQLARALDLAADPDGDGDLADRLDVVNLSLGSRFGATDEADALAADRLAALGTVVVASAGNEGDVYAVGGSPGTAPRALTVAASVDPHGDADGITVLAPEPLAGVVPGHWSSAYQGWTTEDVTGELAAPVDRPDGCTPFGDGDRQRIAGRIAVLAWSTRESERACGSAVRTGNAAAAGAVGVLLAPSDDHLAEIAGDARIPAVLVGRADGEQLRQAAAAGPVRVRLAAPGNPLRGVAPQDQPERTDTLTDFTSRGIGVPGTVKPDLAAPGETIWSAAVGTGTRGIREDGTSMAAPHVAGLAALLRAAHPDRTVEQVKAALMNTAEDTRLGPNRTGPLYGPERAGAGRARVDRALRTPAVAYAAGEGAVPGSVGVSFGPLAVDGPLRQTREVEVRNLSGTAVEYRTGYAAATELPGAAFEVTPERVTVPAGGTARVAVTLAVPGELGRTPDPTIAVEQAGRARSYRAELSGLLLLTPAGADVPGLRVPLFAAPRPASGLTATAQARTGAGTVVVAVNGSSLPGGRPGLLSAFALGGEGRRWADCPADAAVPGARPGAGIGAEDADPAATEEVCVERPGDRIANLREVGAAVADGTLYLAARLWAPAATPAGVIAVRVSLDTDGDGTTDAYVRADRLRGSDVLVARTVDARSGAELDVQPLNAHWGDTDTALLDTDAFVLPVRLAALPGAGGGLRYGVWTGVVLPGKTDPAEAFSAVGLRGTRPVIPFDPGNPPLTVRVGVGGPPAVVAPVRPGGLLDVRHPEGATPPGLLLLHHLNPDATRGQLVRLP